MGKLAKTEGEVFVRTNAKTTILQFYEEDFILDDSIETLAEARSFIQKGLIGERLRKKIEGFKAVRTCQVIEFTNTDEEPQVSEFEKLLVKAQRLGCVPQSLDSYDGDKAKIKALQKAIDADAKRKSKAKIEEPQETGYVE